MKKFIYSNSINPFDLKSTWKALEDHLGTQDAGKLKHARQPCLRKALVHLGTQGTWAFELYIYIYILYLYIFIYAYGYISIHRHDIRYISIYIYIYIFADLELVQVLYYLCICVFINVFIALPFWKNRVLELLEKTF